MPDARNLQESASSAPVPTILGAGGLFVLDGMNFELYVFARTVPFFPLVAL
jgi:hypothetical protein